MQKNWLFGKNVVSKPRAPLDRLYEIKCRYIVKQKVIMFRYGRHYLHSLLQYNTITSLIFIIITLTTMVYVFLLVHIVFGCLLLCHSSIAFELLHDTIKPKKKFFNLLTSSWHRLTLIFASKSASSAFVLHQGAL